MADGTPDFADLLAAFDEAPVASLHQITSGHGGNLHLGSGQLSLNQPYIPPQNHAQFHQVNQRVGPTQNPLGQIPGINQSAGLRNQAFIQPDVVQASAASEESFGGGSLGSLFLSSVESMLSDQGTDLMVQVQQQQPPTAQPAKSTQRKPKPQRQKHNTVQQNRTTNVEQNRNFHNANTQQYVNIAPAAASVQATVALSNTGLNANALGMKMTNAVSSPPFVIPSEMQSGTANISLAGQQKMHQGPFIHPMQGTRQQIPPVNPPRPLSAASSTSEHLSRPGSVPQPSPSCGSNHSGDPATPLTPQSYNAGTPQSYNAGTPQSYNAGTPQSYNAGTPQSYNAGTPQSYNAGTSQSYNAGTPQSYKPATPGSNLATQQRQRGGYGDLHQQQVSSAGVSESFVSNQRNNMMFQPQPSPIQLMNTSNDALSDLPTPVKDIFNASTTSAGPFHTQSSAVRSQQQFWNQGPSVMAPDALFTSTAQPKAPNLQNFMPTENQMNFGYSDIYGVPTAHNSQIPQRLESNARSESLTSKQNALLEQLSSFGKSKSKQSDAPEESSFDSGISSKYPDVGKSENSMSKSESNDTMNMMEKANTAGAAAVKELLGAHPQYEAISPVSDYGMSPVQKSSLQDDLSETITFSPPKFSSASELLLPVPQDMGQTHEDLTTDPVLMYLKHDDSKSTGTLKGSTSFGTTSHKSGSSFFTQDVTGTSELSTSSHPSWLEQNSSMVDADHQNLLQSSSYFPNARSGVPNLPTPSLPSNSSNKPSNTAFSMSAWNSQLSTANTDRTPPQSQFSHPDVGKMVASSPTKQSSDSNRASHASYKQKSQTPPTQSSKVSDNKPFGVSRRKSSTDKSKFSSPRSKKTSNFDEKFGFDSDDDEEPTICLSKASPKASKKPVNASNSKPQPNQISPKPPPMANTFVGEDLKNKMEHLKKLQQQQEMLRKIEEYQAQHGGPFHATATAVSKHRTATTQPPTTKSSISHQPELYRKASQEDYPAFSSQLFSKFPLLPATTQPTMTTQSVHTKRPSLEFPVPLSLAQTTQSLHTKRPSLEFPVPLSLAQTTQSLHTKRPSLEFPAPLSLAQPTVSPKFQDLPKASVANHDIHPSLPSMQQSYSSSQRTSTASNQPPHFLGYFPPELSGSAQHHTPPIATTSFTVQHSIPVTMVTSTPPTSTPFGVQSSFLMRPSKTSTSELPSYNTSVLQSELGLLRRVSQAPTQVSSSVAISKGRDSAVVSSASALQPKSSHSHRPHPFENTHFLDWLHREPLATENQSIPDSATIRSTKTPPKPSLSLNSHITASSQLGIPSSAITSAPTSKPMPSMFTIPEDNAMPLKQSIHTVHHLDIPKSQSVVVAQASTATTKESVPVLHETKHLNFKKHRILEGAYPQSLESYVPSHSGALQSNNQPATKTQTIRAHSVLDKQRRYSKERASAKPRHRIQHQVTDLLKPQTQTPPAQSKNATKVSTTKSSSKVADVDPKPSRSDVATVEKKDDQAGSSMLLLFNSLLQEASESAKGSLKTTLTTGTKQDEKTFEKVDSEKVSSPLPVSKPVTPEKSKVVTSSVEIVKTAVSTVTTTSVTQPSSHQNVPPKKPAKKNRPAATVPFKRRPYPAVDDSHVAIMTKTVPITTTAPQKTSITMSVATSTTKTTPTTTQSSKVTSIITPVSLPQTKPVSVTTTTSLPTPVISTTSKEVVKSPTIGSVSEQSPSKSVGLPKLRITTFRSSKGQIIHHAAVLGVDTESVDSDHSTHRKHKKKKRKKRKRKVSSSDYDSAVSSATVNSTSEHTAILEQKAKINEQITKELDRKAQEILKSAEVAVVKEPMEEERVVQKRKRTKTADPENPAEKKKQVKRVRITKPSAKKKQDAKTVEPVVRYQSKSMLQSTSSTSGVSSTTTKAFVSLPSTFHRAPGKLPLYLTSSDSKSTAAVPTIQLVARNTKLIGTADSKISQPTKVVSVKIANSLQSKSFPTHLLTNSGVQYIIPSTRVQQRVLLPNVPISTPVTVPVSIVSPLLARSFPSGFVPVSILSTTTSPSTSTKPQLFTVPISFSDSISTPIKIISTKRTDASKSRSSGVSGAKLALSVPPTATKPTLGSLSISTKLVAPSVTVTGTLTTPRVATKVLSPSTSIPTNANTFQSTFLKLISSQNPVPRYVPPSPPAHLKMDLSDREHVCLECKDTFMFNDSLEHHYQRRCILIKVRCMQCDQDLVFLNKCKLLLHARQHSDKGGNGMQFNNAHISPLPMMMCKPRLKESFLKINASSTSEQRSSVINIEDEALNIGTSVGTPATYPTMLTCTDCNFVGTSAEALEEHFQRVSTPVSPEKATGPKPATNFSCDMCTVTVPNQCSFNAHMRMHKRATPHTCPECGQTFDNDGLQEHAYSESRREIDFNLHLSIHCFHLSRMSAYKCKICTSIFKNADLLRRHLEVRHLQTFYKCRDCPMAFKTQENISGHQRTAHGIVAVTKTIHKCPLCETVFTDNSTTQQLFLLQKHFEGHMSHPSINITAYKCLFCSNIYERKCLLRDHLKSAHDVTASGDSGGRTEISKEWKEARLLLGVDKNGGTINVTNKRPVARSAGKEPAVKVPKILGTEKNAVNNTLIASGIIGGLEGSKKNSTSDPAMMKSAKQPLKLRLKGMTAHSANGMSRNIVQKVIEPGLDDDMDLTTNVGAILRDGKKVYPCGECSKELPSASARINHIRLKHKGIRTLFCCPHCPPGKIKFAKKISLKKHLKKAHSIDEVRKQDVVTEYVKLPVGQRFDPTVLNLEKGYSPQKDTNNSSENKVRKKITAVGRRPNRPMRQVRRDVESPYVENSDSEVEQIMSNNSYSNIEDTEKSEDENLDFSVLKFPEIYSCAKCDFECKDRIEFQAHILEHREDAENEGMLSTMQQCTECGLCFASDASHAKHLFIKHKIKRKKLLEKFDQQLIAERELSGSLPGLLAGDGKAGTRNGPGSAKKHKCSVCYKRFEDDSRLRTHMRTHGLAFVKSKHAS